MTALSDILLAEIRRAVLAQEAKAVRTTNNAAPLYISGRIHIDEEGYITGVTDTPASPVRSVIGALLARVARHLQRPEHLRRLAVESDCHSRTSRNPEGSVCLSCHSAPHAPMFMKGRLEVDRERGEFVIRSVQGDVAGGCDDPKRSHPGSVDTAPTDAPVVPA